MAGKTAKLNWTLTSTDHYNKDYGYKAVRRQDVCHTNTGLRKKCIKDRADTVRKSWQFLRLIQIEVSLRYWTLQEQALLRLIAKTNEVDPGLTLEIVSLQIYGDSAMWAILVLSGRSKLCLFNTFHSNRIKNIRISFLTFPLYKSQK